MHLHWVSFNFAGTDLEAEERHYLEHHARLARRFPGLRFYFTGRARPVRGAAPEHCRAALLGFDDAQAAGAAMASPVAAELIADTQAHIRDLRSLAIEGEWALKFAPRRPGAACFLFMAEFDFTPGLDYARAERNYLSVHVEIAKRLPGLRGYLIGRTLGAGADARRAAICIFDTAESLREAFRSPAGLELSRDGEATIVNLRACHLDARVEL